MAAVAITPRVEKFSPLDFGRYNTLSVQALYAEGQLRLIESIMTNIDNFQRKPALQQLAYRMDGFAEIDWIAESRLKSVVREVR